MADNIRSIRSLPSVIRRRRKIIAFVVPKPGVAHNSYAPGELIAHIDRTEGPTLRPQAIHIVAELPKTHSGKIVRRAIRQVCLGQEVEDSSALENPAALNGIVTSVDPGA